LPVAYVQLKPGAIADESGLAEFLRDEIGERAALPKRIRIVDTMPITGVGKIFKPELKRREAADVVCMALAEAGIEWMAVMASLAGPSGVSIRVELQDSTFEQATKAVLGRYPFGFETSIASNARYQDQTD
jgi:fatty-acyl-CoA synthase